MQNIASFAGWDIVSYENFDPASPTTWYIEDGDDYPRLSWEYKPPAPITDPAPVAPPAPIAPEPEPDSTEAPESEDTTTDTPSQQQAERRNVFVNRLNQAKDEFYNKPLHFYPLTPAQIAGGYMFRTGIVEMHQHAINMARQSRALAYQALIQAERALREGNLELAEEQLSHYHDYYRLTLKALNKTNEIRLGSLDAYIAVTNAVYQTCKFTVKVGAGLFGPQTSMAANALFLSTDYYVDQAMRGQSEANRNLAKNAAITAVFMGVPFNELGGQTIDQAAQQMTDEALGEIIAQLIQSEQAQEAIAGAVTGLSKEAIMRIAEHASQNIVEPVQY